MTTLPTEIVQRIASHVPVSSSISLKLAARVFYFALSSPPSGYLNIASDCEKRAVRRYVTERIHMLSGRRKCIICEGLMPLGMYHNRIEPVCKWHLRRFERDHDVEESAVTRDMEAMVAARATRTLCGHCKNIRSSRLGRCACDAGHRCESCGIWETESRVKVAL